MHTYKLLSSAVLLTLITSWNTQAQTIAMAIRTSAVRPAAAEKHKFFANPILLDGKPLDFTFFTTSSRGKLTLVAGNPETDEATKIPFRVYLQRNGITVLNSVLSSDRQVYDLDVTTILAKAQHGDELVIEPIDRTDWGARRVINLKSPHWIFWFRQGC